MEISEQLSEIVSQAIQSAIESGELSIDGEAPEPALERPRDKANGDWASTVAMRSAKLARRSPVEIADIIIRNIPENGIIGSTNVAGAGFINFKLKDAVLQNVVSQVRVAGRDYGKGKLSEPIKVNLEYVSANPTGPMHVGHGRWAALGDSIARVMRHAGYDVYEEFYINDHGVQMDVFGNSVSVRYMQLLGHDVEMPEACYGGGYVKDIAQKIIDEEGNKYESYNERERLECFREIAYEMMLEDQHDICNQLGTTFDKWFSERSLYVNDESGKSQVDYALDAMREKGYIFEKDGATWFRSTDLGDDKDRVLIKSDGEMTYFTSDVAYHYNKKQRGFDHLIDLWGADHHGYIKRCECMMEAWGYKGELEVVLGQLVNLFRDGEAVRMSKRTGEMVTLRELVEEVGVDATRYTLLSKSSDQAIDFDIDVAKKKDSTNPVYYVQYAYARICSILRNVADSDIAEKNKTGEISADELSDIVIPNDVDLGLLTHESELALMRKIDEFKDFIELAARDRAPFRCTHFAEELAGLFHGFYTNCKVIQDDKSLQDARLALCDATRRIIALNLELLGVSAPVSM